MHGITQLSVESRFKPPSSDFVSVFCVPHCPPVEPVTTRVGLTQKAGAGKKRKEGAGS